MLVTHITEKIEITPGVAGGQPCITGTRFTVKQIAVWSEYMGMSVDEIAHTYGLEPSAIHAALAYYFDNRASIQQAIRQEELLVEKLKKQYPSKIKGSHA